MDVRLCCVCVCVYDYVYGGACLRVCVWMLLMTASTRSTIELLSMPIAI